MTEKEFDEMLKIAASLVAEDMGREILAQDVSGIEISPRHEQRMKEFFDKIRKEIDENEAQKNKGLEN